MLGRPLDPSYLSVKATFDVEAPMDAYGSEIFAPDTDTVCRNNLAFLLLDRDLDLTPAPIRVGKGVALGESTLIAGFGINDSGSASERYERAGVPIVAVGESEFAPDGYGSIQNTFAIGTGPCSGDFGGPAFSEETGALLGVMALQYGGDCRSPTVRNIYTQLAPYEETISEAFAASGYSPVLEDDSSMTDFDADASAGRDVAAADRGIDAGMPSAALGSGDESEGAGRADAGSPSSETTGGGKSPHDPGGAVADRSRLEGGAPAPTIVDDATPNSEGGVRNGSEEETEPIDGTLGTHPRRRNASCALVTRGRSFTDNGGVYLLIALLTWRRQKPSMHGCSPTNVSSSGS